MNPIDNQYRTIENYGTAETVEKIANKYNLIKTGGTDLHGLELE